MGKRLYNDRRERVRDLLKQVRVEADLTQTQLAAELKRHQSYISDYERGHRRLDWVAVEDVLTACKSDLVTFARRYVLAIATGETK